MSSDPTITCPACNTEIRLTDGLAAPIIAATRKEFEAERAAMAIAAARREAEVQAREEELVQARATLNTEVAQQVAAARQQLETEAQAKAQATAQAELAARAAELADLRKTLAASDEKLAAAQAAQAEALRLKRTLDEQKRALDLTIEQRVSAENEKVRLAARAEAETALGLKLSEREQQIATLTRTIDELKRKSEQGSQQLQGEVQELALEDLLRARFPADLIEPVAKGQSGADALQRVTGPGGTPCGAILWETKRTKAWSDGWLTKLRADQRTAGAEVAILVSAALPKDIDSFGQIDGVWVCAPKFTVPLALTLRQSLTEIAATRAAAAGQDSKMALIYDYLTGPRFRHRVQAIVEKFDALQGDLNRERKFMIRQWAKREAEIHGAIAATVGMHGDFQGIAGRAIQEIEGLDLPALEDGSGD